MRIAKHTPKGFALVVAITLMAFILMLTLSLSLLVTVEASSTQSKFYQNQARQNALLGLQEALGTLQAELGPDHRVNALASQLLPEDTSSPRKYWIGVYEGWTDATGQTLEGLAAESRPNPTFRRWLVSARDSAGGGAPAWLSDRNAVASGTLEQAVTLVGGTGASRVEAGLVDFDRTHAYAWWIGDENAKVTLHSAPPSSADFTSWLTKRQGNANPAYSLIQDLESLSGNDSRLDRLGDRNALDLLLQADNNEAFPHNNLYHRVTTHAHGVLSNTRRGGLRRDLSLYLEKTPDELRNLAGSDAEDFFGGLYTTPGLRHNPADNRRLADSYYLTMGSPQEVDLGGIHFGELWTYYNLWKNLEGSAASPRLVARYHRGTHGDFNGPQALYKSPIMLNGGMLLAVKTAPGTPSSDGIEPDKYDIELRFDAVATIWNPYDVTLEVPSDIFSTTIHAAEYEIFFRKSKLPGSASGSTVIKDDGDNTVYRRLAWGNHDTFNSITLLMSNLTLQPGEVLVFSASGSEGVTIDTSDEGQRARVTGRPGWLRDGGFTGVGSEATGSDANSIRNVLDGDDYLYVQINRPLNSRGGEASNNPGFMMSGGRSDTRRYAGIHASMEGSSETITSGGAIFNAAAFPYGQRPQHRFDNTQFRPYFNQIPRMEVGRADTLSGESHWRDVAFFTTYMRTEENQNPWPGVPFLRHFNPAATLYHINSYAEEDIVAQPFVFQAYALHSNNDIDGILNVDSNNRGFFGGGYRADNGVNHIISHSIPRRPIWSLADFQHAAALGRGHYSVTEEQQSWTRDTYRVGNRIEPAVGRVIGNSYALPVLEANQVRGFTNPRSLVNPVDSSIPGVPAVDHSYLANFYLWDDWFFSSIAPEPNASFSIVRSQQDVLDDFLAGTQPLPNARMRRSFEADPDFVLNGEAYRLSASQLLVQGSFNINTTDPEVWAAQLARLRGMDVPLANPQSGATSWETSGNNETPIPGLHVPGAGPLTFSDFSQPSHAGQWLGFRKLTDTQIHELARAIVSEVRQRGPFLSLADFVNRRPGNDPTLAKSGALQAALDATINPQRSDMGASRWLGTNPNVPFPEAMDVPKAQGMAGWVNQADLLSALGPFISARSDTFTIRAYGEVRNPINNRREARAWCEAIVQRLPDFVDPTNPAHTPLDSAEASQLGLSPLSADNRHFGRRFVVVDFRWLSENEL